ncbi:MAG: DUF4291 domain-containing protein [Steroidobacteraceae bacterium]
MSHHSMITRLYSEQSESWPKSGRHILARYDAESVYVYQAYRPPIARYAVDNQKFGGPDFSYARMSWIKPNFLWMMYRCGWASKEGQEHVLAVRLRRSFFDEILIAAVPSSFGGSQSGSRDGWRRAVESADVRLQWDPDHDPFGKPLQRKAIQLGLRGRSLARYGREAILSVEDITPFVTEQARQLCAGLDNLIVPEEHVYSAPTVAARNVGAD